MHYLNQRFRRTARRAALAATFLTLAVSITAPATSLASCEPPTLQAFADEPGRVAVAGTVLEVSPGQVAVDVDLWWGDDPQRSVVIDRPASDPTVITSVDWNPNPGERWIILARRDGGVLRTNICEQFVPSQATVREVETSLGPGIVPAASEEPTPAPAQTPDRDAGPGLPVIAGIALAIALAGGVALMLVLRRRTSS